MGAQDSTSSKSSYMHLHLLYYGAMEFYYGSPTVAASRASRVYVNYDYQIVGACLFLRWFPVDSQLIFCGASL